jgi:hypothetical protein
VFAHAAVSKTAWRPPSPAATVGISTWRACAAGLWLASIEVTIV